MTWQNSNTSKSCILNYVEKYMFAIKSYQIRKLYANISLPYFILYTTNNTIYSNNLHYMLHKAIYIYVYLYYIYIRTKNLTLCDLSQKHFMKMTLQIPYISLCIVSSSGL